MSYDNLTKAELIELLKQQEHLAKAVETKDKEITDLTKKYKKLEEDLIRLNAEVQNNKHLTKAVENKDKEISEIKKHRAEELAAVKQEEERIKTSMRYQIEEYERQLKELPDIELMKNVINELTNKNRALANFVKEYTQAYRNHLQLQQTHLDTAIQLESFITKELQNLNKNEGVK